jgi:hypothetical protein
MIKEKLADTVSLPQSSMMLISAINAGDREAFCSLFSQLCIVDALGFRLFGVPALGRWVQEELVNPGVQLFVEHEIVLDELITMSVVALDRGFRQRCVIAITVLDDRIETLAITYYKGYQE